MNLNTIGCCYFLLVIFGGSCQIKDQAVPPRVPTKLEWYESKFYEHLEKNHDSVFYYLNLRKALIGKHDHTKAGWQLVYDHCKYFFTTGDYAASKDYGVKALKVAEKLSDSILLGRSLNMLGNVQHKLGNFPSALDHLHSSLNIYRQTGNHGHTSIPLNNIGLVYKDMREYDKAEEAFKESLEINKQLNDTFGLSLDYNHLGITLKKAQKYEAAKENFFRSLAMAQQLNDAFQKAIVYNNLGLVAAEERDFRQAIEYLEEALVIKRELKMKSEIAITANYLAEVYVKNGDFSPALALSREALEISGQSGAKDQTSKAFQILSTLSEAKGDIGKALSYYKSFKMYEDSMFNETRARQIAEMEAIYESGKKEKQIIQLTVAKQEETLKRTWYVTILTALLGLLMVFGLGMHFRNKKNKQLSDAKIKSYELALENFTQNLLEKNQRIEKLNTDLAKARDEISNTCPSYTNTMDNLMQSPILTDEDWMRFKKLFLQAHPGFFNNLRQKFPDITQTEERLIALTRLKLKTKEIASMVGISVDSVNKSRYRMRKKLGVSSGEMETFVSGF